MFHNCWKFYWRQYFLTLCNYWNSFGGKMNFTKIQNWISYFYECAYEWSIYMQAEIAINTYLFLKYFFFLYPYDVLAIYPCFCWLRALEDMHDIQHILFFDDNVSLKLFPPLPSVNIPSQILIYLMNKISQAEVVSAAFLLNRKYSLLMVLLFPHDKLVVSVKSFWFPHSWWRWNHNWVYYL